MKGFLRWVEGEESSLDVGIDCAGLTDSCIGQSCFIRVEKVCAVFCSVWTVVIVSSGRASAELSQRGISL